MTPAELNTFITDYYAVIVVSIFALFATIETFAPLRANQERLTFRWFNNIALMALIMLFFKLVGPLLALLSAYAADRYGLGLFNRLDLGFLPILVASVLLLDFKQYLFHRAMHHFDLLWRIHRVHHSDLDIDLTSGFRFHPFEVLLSATVDVAVVVLFGIPPEVILLHQVLIFFTNFFTHSNLRLPGSVDRILKRVLVTPSVHHLHHALEPRAANHNFGVIFTVWDRLFGSFMERHPQTESGDYDYGLEEYREGDRLNLWVLLKMPFGATKTFPREDVLK